MLERETASIIKFVLINAGNPMPYYYQVPQDFLIPAVYFPPPEINTNGDTFHTYGMEFTWFIKFFHKTEQEVYTLASMTLSAIKRARNVIPLIDENGEQTEHGLRLKDPSLNIIDGGAAQLQIGWISRRQYCEIEYIKTREYILESYIKENNSE